TAQGACMHQAAENRRILHGRHENQTIHDENGMRHYYEEWGRWLNRLPSDPDRAFADGAGGRAAVARDAERELALEEA
ncbi:MAG: hypothetical protein OXU22_02315, partial [Gammaproteobacteria bacterium]|nr:hypothetical protein [Gammaproteobacteria bacterium]